MLFQVLFTSLALLTEGPAVCRVGAATVAQIRNERITGSLEAAETEARQLLECPELEDVDRIALQIELAKILDRVGLHHNTRPVVESLEILRRAQAAIDAADSTSKARVELALAEYFYRAEMSERKFTVATENARRAEALFRDLDDPVGETDAVHRLGLIELQKSNLQEARKLFDRSLVLSRKGPHRLIFLSDYHRHVGFIDRASGDLERAILRFEKSLDYRNQAGSRDYGLFARTMLGTALIEGGRPEEAREYLEQALQIARDIRSPVGELRATYALGKMYETLGDFQEAVRRFRRAEEQAAELGVASIQKAAQDGVTRLSMTSEESNPR